MVSICIVVDVSVFNQFFKTSFRALSSVFI